MRVKHVLVAKLLFSVCACQSAAECAPVKLSVGQFVDHSCHIFRRIKENGVSFVVKEKDGKVIAREAVDCSKAVLDDDGTYEYQLHIADGQIYCPSHKEDYGRTAQRNH